MNRHAYKRGDSVLVRAKVYSGDQEYEDVLHLVTEGYRRTFPVRLTDIEHQRARLPAELVERIRAEIGCIPGNVMDALLCDILAAVKEGKE